MRAEDRPETRQTLFPRDDPHEWANHVESAIIVLFCLFVFLAVDPMLDLMQKWFPNLMGVS